MDTYWQGHIKHDQYMSHQIKTNFSLDFKFTSYISSCYHLTKYSFSCNFRTIYLTLGYFWDQIYIPIYHWYLAIWTNMDLCGPTRKQLQCCIFLIV